MLLAADDRLLGGLGKLRFSGDSTSAAPAAATPWGGRTTIGIPGEQFRDGQLRGDEVQVFGRDPVPDEMCAQIRGVEVAGRLRGALRVGATA